MSRAILHSDMNNFYASVEILRDPSLKGKPVAVCGLTEERHGIVLAKNMQAKKAGVKTGMVNWEARALCPDLITVEPHYDDYIRCSVMAREIYCRYTDIVEPYGMDECWLDITNSSLFGNAGAVAEEIRRTVKKELGLTVSIGVSFNKVFAKLGSDMKKPNAVTVITEDNFRDKLWPLAASELIYIGRATMNKLNKYGIFTIGDVASAEPSFLKTLLGVNGLKLWTYANGNDTSVVKHIDCCVPVKSVGHGTTCSADLNDIRQVHNVILELAQDVGHRLRLHGLAGMGIQLSVRGDDLNFCSFRDALPYPTQLSTDIARYACRLFDREHGMKQKVRAVTVRAIDLVPERESWQMDIYHDYSALERKECLQTAVENVRERYGKSAVTYCSLLNKNNIPHDGRDLVIMPGLMYA